MRPRFQADADLNEDLITGVMRREPAIDFQTAMAASLRGVPDPEFVSRQTSPGVLIVSQSAHLGRVIDDLILIWSASGAEEWTNVLDYIPL